MNRRSLASSAVLALLVAIQSLVLASAAPKTWTPPRTADGQLDLQGVWLNNAATLLERPKALQGRQRLTDDEEHANAGGTQRAAAAAPAALDFEYFKTKVQPIFLAKRPGHARCIACHSSGTPLRLQPLSPGSATWNDEQSLRNFEAIQRVVVPGSVAKSPILTHPLAEQAGGDFFHSGGKHWDSQNDPEWQTLKTFVLGR